MKSSILLAISSFLILNSAFGQGFLTPPGPPAPTMKSLDQIEARTPISSAPFTITKQGSYYLTTNLTVTTGNGVTIATNGVRLDLSGFTISSTAASATGYGILINGGLRNLTIVNGFIQGGVTNNGSNVYSSGGFAYGIYYSGIAPGNVLASGISVSGCLDYGIFLGTGNSTVVESCTVMTVGSYGIYATTIKNCSATDCGYTAIFGLQVSDSRGVCTGGGYGISTSFIAQNCYGSSSTGNGVYTEMAENCYGASTSNTGLNAVSAHNCYGISSSATGLYCVCAENCYGLSSSSIGMEANNALSCFGESAGNYGILTGNAENCYGYCGGSGYGIDANNVANGCFGGCPSGIGISAFIANVCHGTGATPVSSLHNINSF